MKGVFMHVPPRPQLIFADFWAEKTIGERAASPFQVLPLALN